MFAFRHIFSGSYIYCVDTRYGSIKNPAPLGGKALVERLRCLRSTRVRRPESRARGCVRAPPPGAPRARRRGVRRCAALVRTVFLRYLDISLQYLTVSPRISLHLIASPRISPYLPVSARIRPYLVSPGISRYLPVSPGILPYPAISRHIPPRIPRKKPSTPGMLLSRGLASLRNGRPWSAVSYQPHPL